MKKLKLNIAAALCVLACSTAKSQPYYGQTLYGHGTLSFFELGSGVQAGNANGFIMAGFARNMNVSTNSIFSLDKTDVDGQFNPGTFFSKEYIVNYPLTCGGVTTPARQCSGVTAITNNPALSGGPLASGVNYLLTGAIDRGIFFAGVDVFGTVGTTGYYPLPAGAVASKPHIVQFSTGAAGVGHYYISGHYNLSGTIYMYILKVDDSGALLFSSSTFDMGTGTFMQSWDLIESPYVSGELVVVGWCQQTPGIGSDGFLMHFDDALQTVTQLSAFDAGGGPGINDFMISINLAASTSATGFPGFIVGGYSNRFASEPWMTFIDYNGTVGWSRIITPTGTSSGGRVIAVTERLNSTSQYEYYGVTLPVNNNVIVFKLDDSGNPAANNSEFHYNPNTISPTYNSIGEDITFDNNPSSPELGLQIYGTAFNNSTSAFRPSPYLIMACFNGASGCMVDENLMNIPAINSVNPGFANPPYSQTTGVITACAGISINSTGLGSALLQCPLSTGVPSNGDNTRHMATTAIKENTGGAGLSLYPNPASRFVEIALSDGMANASYELQNSLGQHIATLPVLGSQRIDLSGLNLANGIYLIKISSGKQMITQKLIIQNN